MEQFEIKWHGLISWLLWTFWC